MSDKVPGEWSIPIEVAEQSRQRLLKLRAAEVKIRDLEREVEELQDNQKHGVVLAPVQGVPLPVCDDDGCADLSSKLEAAEKRNAELEADYERINFLDQRTSKGKVIFRMSGYGRGWRLHETQREGAVDSVRDAIDSARVPLPKPSCSVLSIDFDDDVIEEDKNESDEP